MQPFTPEFARSYLTPQGEALAVGKYRYRAELSDRGGEVLETGPDGEKRYRIEHALGGKNVYYFLTPREKGRLQVLPVAYDVRKKEWFDTTGSMIRHFAAGTEQPIEWKNWRLTFNTACYGCHVSQLSTNYDHGTDTYKTVWREPGINCETCHGPADEHIRVCLAAPKGTVPRDLKMTRGGRSFSKEQNNATCSSCHAKSVVMTSSFKPGDRFFDHFDLVTLESADFYPDGRDLGENYTYTSWIMSPCVKSGKLDCLHCHTSSGRYKFKAAEKANDACLPCHEARVKDATAHTRHKADTPGNACISCHMPTTEFARMNRTDHSMLPPTPAATMAFKSPNACNLCHKDQTPEWADQWVRKWRARDYQAPVLLRAGLIAEARTRDWRRLPEMLAYVESKDRDEVFATSLLRLLGACNDDRKWPTVVNALADPSPLVRSAAAEALAVNPSQEVAESLLRATADDCRLVRIRSATALSAVPAVLLKDRDLSTLRSATEEYLESLRTRPDQWTSHYNLGNYYLNRGQPRLALAAFENASTLDPEQIVPIVNVSIALARLGELGKAEETLSRALRIDPKSAPAHFNMGLLKAEQKDLLSAEKELRAALGIDPMLAEAAYNLSIILAKDRPDEALIWARKAAENRPDDPKYAYTLAFYEQQRGNTADAVKVLEDLIRRHPSYVNAYVLLGDMYEKQGRTKEAVNAYQRVLATGGLSPRDRLFIEAKLKKLSLQ